MTVDTVIHIEIIDIAGIGYRQDARMLAVVVEDFDIRVVLCYRCQRSDEIED